MRSEATEPTEQEILDGYLEHPPDDRKVDFLWTGGASGPSQRSIAWRTACRGGTISDIGGKIPGLVTALVGARSDLAKATARLSTERAAELEHFIASTEERISEFTAIVEAAGGEVSVDEHGRTKVSGGWIDCDQRALDRAVGQADFLLREAAGKVDPYRERWPPIKDFEAKFAVELREVAKAQAALKAAQKAAAESLGLLDVDRAELMKLKQRRVA